MSLSPVVLVKIAVGTAAAAVLAGAGGAVVVRQHDAPARRPLAPAGADALMPSDGIGTGDGEVVFDPGTGAVRLLTATGEARAGAGAGARTKGGPGSGAEAPAGAPAPSARAGGSAASRPPASAAGSITLPGSGGGDAGGTPAGSGGTGAGPGGSGGSGASPEPSPGGGNGGSHTPTAPPVPAVTAPAVPGSASAHSQGDFSVVVPGTDKVSKKLCLSGTALNRCQTVTVPALRPVELTVAYSGNAGVKAPTFTTAPCPGGASVGVSGLTPGATVTVTVEGRRLSATVPERGAHQTASLCDA